MATRKHSAAAAKVVGPQFSAPRFDDGVVPLQDDSRVRGPRNFREDLRYLVARRQINPPWTDRNVRYAFEAACKRWHISRRVGARELRELELLAEELPSSFPEAAQ